MEREAKLKDEISRKELVDYIMEDFYFDKIPKSKCKILDVLFAKTTFCITKCYSPCKNFRTFKFITNRCDAVECDEKEPCQECMSKIEDFKEFVMQIKAIYYRTDLDRSVNARLRESVDQSLKPLNEDMKDKHRGMKTRKLLQGEAKVPNSYADKHIEDY